jgi:hypothetical protein
LGTKHVNTPVKVRRTQGKIISKLVVSYDGLLVNVITGRTKKDTFQIDALRWKIDVTSLSKAVAKVEKSTVYERSIGLALGRELTNQVRCNVAAEAQLNCFVNNRVSTAS